MGAAGRLTVQPRRLRSEIRLASLVTRVQLQLARMAPTKRADSLSRCPTRMGRPEAARARKLGRSMQWLPKMTRRLSAGSCRATKAAVAKLASRGETTFRLVAVAKSCRMSCRKAWLTRQRACASRRPRLFSTMCSPRSAHCNASHSLLPVE